jgi:hypothetical protein
MDGALTLWQYSAYLSRFERVTDGARTRDLRSHNPMLYQLSYGHQAHARFYQEKASDITRRIEGQNRYL